VITFWTFDFHFAMPAGNANFLFAFWTFEKAIILALTPSLLEKEERFFDIIPIL
jgi:hypothetical protein